MRGAFGKEFWNDNGKRILAFAREKRLALLNIFFRTPKRGVSYTFQSPDASKARYRLDYVIIRQKDCRLTRNIPIHKPTVLHPKSGHNLVFSKTCLLGRFATNHPKLDTNQTRRAMNVQKLMADPTLRKEVL